MDLYPSCKVRLIIRFEDYGAGIVAAQAAKLPNKKVTQGTTPPAILDFEQDPSAPPGVTRWLLSGGASNGQAIFDQDSSDDGLTHAIGGIIPKAATWKQTGTRTADELTLTLKLVDMPIDVRTVRFAAVQFYFGVVSASDFAAGLEGQTRSTGRATWSSEVVEPLNLIPDEWTDEGGNPRTNLRFEGLVEDWDDDVNDVGEPTLVLKCKDMTSVLIGQELGPAHVIDQTKPLDEGVAKLLAGFPQFEGLAVEYRPAGATAPIPASVLSGPLAKYGVPQAQGAAGESKTTVWDHVTDVCRALGHMVYVEGRTVVVKLVAAHTDASNPPRDDDPFDYVARSSATGMQIQNRVMIYGRNLRRMRVHRNFTKHAPRNAEVRCFDHGKLYVGRWPTTTTPVADAAPGNSGVDQKWTVYTVAGITNENQLKNIAKGYVESRGRREIEVEATTHDLASFGGGSVDPDLCDMRAGDTLDVLYGFDDVDGTGTTNMIEKALFARGADVLRALGYADTFADAYQKALTDGGFQSHYYVKETTLNWRERAGAEFVVSLMNYIEARMADINASEPVQNPSATPAAPTPGVPPVSGGAPVG